MLPSNVSDPTVGQLPPTRSGPRLGGLILTIALLVVLVAIIFVAVTRLPTGPLARPTPATPAAVEAPATTADAATQQAIQDVVRRLNEAQARAIASGDPRVMAETATPDFYAEQVATNEDLVDSGITEIKLLNMEWGPITASGNSATATVYETWSTSFEDGTTLQSRDRNVYALVKDNAGTWRVQRNEHPDAR